MTKWHRAIFIGTGVAAMILATTIYILINREAEAAQQWPHAQGQVVANDLVREETTDTSGTGSNRRTTRRVSWRPVVFYSYTAAGRTYRGDRLWLNSSQSFSTEENGARFLDSYRMGTPLDVRYNPADPSEAAVIVDSLSAWFLLLNLIGVPFIAAGWLLGRRDTKAGR